MKNNYPNLMCFGEEAHKCDLLEACPAYIECREKYYENYFLFMEETADKLKGD